MERDQTRDVRPRVLLRDFVFGILEALLGVPYGSFPNWLHCCNLSVGVVFPGSPAQEGLVSVKYYDYEELWDSFRVTERLALLRNLNRELWERALHPMDPNATCNKKWAALGTPLQNALLALDWEFNLGHKF